MIPTNTVLMLVTLTAILGMTFGVLLMAGLNGMAYDRGRRDGEAAHTGATWHDTRQRLVNHNVELSREVLRLLAELSLDPGRDQGQHLGVER